MYKSDRFIICDPISELLLTLKIASRSIPKVDIHCTSFLGKLSDVIRDYSLALARKKIHFFTVGR